jgi:hypothetical protein
VNLADNPPRHKPGYLPFRRPLEPAVVAEWSTDKNLPFDFQVSKLTRLVSFPTATDVLRRNPDRHAIKPETNFRRMRTTRYWRWMSSGTLCGLIWLTTACSGKKQAPPPAPAAASRDAKLEEKATKESPYINSLEMKFIEVPIPAGPPSDKRVLFSVWETRVRDFEAFIRGDIRHQMDEGLAPLAWSNQNWEPLAGISWKQPGFEQSGDHPVTCVSWWDAVAFCKWLTKTERAARRIGGNDEYRLPTDAEWSFAVGIGDREDIAQSPQEKDGKIPNVFAWGVAWPPPKDFGNFGSDASDSSTSDTFEQTAPVASFPPDPSGLFDLGGNVAEWCNDPYNNLQPGRVLRGASWIRYDREGMALSFRNCASPGYRRTNLGFRCVLVVSNSVATGF